MLICYKALNFRVMRSVYTYVLFCVRVKGDFNSSLWHNYESCIHFRDIMCRANLNFSGFTIVTIINAYTHTIRLQRVCKIHFVSKAISIRSISLTLSLSLPFSIFSSCSFAEKCFQLYTYIIQYYKLSARDR